MSVNTRTSPAMVKHIFKPISSGRVVHHNASDSNKIGQSGLHTLADDIINVVLNSDNEEMAVRNLNKFFREGKCIN